MPCVRGSSSIMQILYYALEDAYLGKINYLGKMASKFGYNQGVTPDLAAMLSPSVEDFIDYVDTYVMDPSVVVRKLPEDERTLQEGIPSQKLEEVLTKIKGQLETYYPFKKGKFDHNRMQYQSNAWIDNLTFLQFLLRDNGGNPKAVLRIKSMLDSLVGALIRGNPPRYQIFYEQLPDKGLWPAPKVLPHHPLESEKDDYLQAFKQLTHALSEYGIACNQIQDQGIKSSHYYQGSSTVRKMKAAATNPKGVSSLLAECIDHLSDNKRETSRLLDEYIQIMLMIEQDVAKKIPMEVTIEALLDRMVVNIEKEYGLQKKVDINKTKNLDTLRKSLEVLYNQSSQLRKSLRVLKPLISELTLSEQSEHLILEERQLEERLSQTMDVTPIESPMIFDELRDQYTQAPPLEEEPQLETALRRLEVGHALMAAIRLGRRDVALRLLTQNDKAINLDVSDALGYTPLMWAIKTNNFELLTKILQTKPNLDLTDTLGNTALWHAMHLGLEYMVSALLAFNPPPSLDIGGFTGSPSRYILYFTCPKHIPNILIPHLNTIQLHQAMHIFAQSGKVELLKTCLGIGAQISDRGPENKTLLMNACESYSLECLELVLQYKPDLEARDSKQMTALMYACGANSVGFSTECAKALIKAGSDVHAVDHHNMTPLLHLLKYLNDDMVDKRQLLNCAMSLIEKGAEIDNEHLNALVLEAVQHDVNVLKALLEGDKGPYINKEEALYLACFHGNEAAAKLLIEHNANTHYIDANNNNCLIMAVCGQNQWIIQTLLDKELDINHQGKQGATALLYAAEDGAEEIVKMLLNNGANVSLVNEQGKSALEVAFEKEHDQVVKMLKEHKEKIVQKEAEKRKPKNEK